MNRLTLLLLLALVSVAPAQDFGVLDGLDPFAPKPANEGAGKFLTITAATPQVTAIDTDEPFYVAIDYTIEPSWHTYGPSQAVDWALPSSITTSFGASATLISVHYPPAEKTAIEDPSTGKTVYVYYLPARGRILAKVQLAPAATASPITLQWGGQLCGGASNQCLPFRFLTPPVTVTRGARTANPAFVATLPTPAAQVVDTDEHSVELANRSDIYILAMALLAGLMINIMPCVLPVIPLRIYSLAQMAGESRRRYITLALAFAGGMMLFFIGLVGLHLFLKLTTSGTQGVSLNLLLTNRPVLVVLIAVLVALSANLFGLFNVLVPSNIANAEIAIESRQEGHGKSMLLGFMMAVLATPCSFGPLAFVMGYVQTRSVGFGAGVLLVVGLGMTSPHLLIAFFPGLQKYLPKPGVWMEQFKQTCGFVVLLVAVYLLSFLRGDGATYPYAVLGWCVVLAFGLWIWGSWIRFDAPLGKKLRIRGLAVLLVVASGFYLLPDESATHYTTPETYSPAAVAAARGEGRIVVVKFDSYSCFECRKQEAEVFNTPDAAELFTARNVAYFKGTIDSNPDARAFLNATDYKLAVPRTYVYPPGDGPGETTVDLDLEKLKAMIQAAARHSAPAK
ncbi:MAG: hypothetical protein HN909_06005 [Phycisphaerales bacterium]|jgi:thiol:disulfide interchange protein|nr:hypothetical protein [Phycisphaerales bacterium]MBT7171306.1 hypothetical protein [Phycisphaerales bacterium]